jgi:putative FmdB family regulatory protein
MPIYEYQCGNCGHVFDALQKMSDAPLRDCPECHKSELKKLLSAPKFRLSGGGWYETDFKTGDKRNIAEAAASTTAKPAEPKKAATD